MAQNEIRVNLDVTGEQVAAAKLGKVEAAAEGAGDAIQEMGGQATVAGKATEAAGDEFRETGQDAGYLSRQVDELTASYKDLIRQLNETGDTSLRKDIRTTRRDLRENERLLKDITPDPTPAAGAIGDQLVGGLATAIEASGKSPIVAGAIGALAAMAAPGLGAGIAAAVLGSVGAGGIIGGVALAAQDERVKSAGSQLGESLLGDLTVAAEPFVDPLLRGMAKIRDAGSGIARDLAPSFDKLSARVEPLVDGLIAAAQEALPGFTAALDAAGPVIDVLAKELPEIGDAVGDFLTTVSGESAGAELFLEQMLETAQDLIQISGEVIAWMSQTYEAAYAIADALGLIEPEVIGKKFEQAEPSVAGFGKSAEDAARELRDLDSAINDVLGRTFGLEEAQDRAADAVAALKEQVKQQHEENVKGAGSLVGNTQAARDNRDAIRDLDRRYAELIVEHVAAGKSTDGLRAQFVAAAVQAGLNRKEVEKYANALFNIPAVVNTTIKVKTEIEKGSATAWSMQRAAERQLEGRASGGPVMAGQTYMVGERGPELVTFGANGMVHNASQTQQMLSGASGGASASAGAGVQVLVSVRQSESSVMTALASAIVPYLQIEVVNQGGDVTTVLGPPGR